MLKTYQYPRSQRKSELYTVRVWSEKSPETVIVPEVLYSKVGHFVSLEFNEPVIVEVLVHQEKGLKEDEVKIRPLRHEIHAEVKDRTIRFRVDEPKHLKVDVEVIEQEMDLFLYCNKVEALEEIPKKDDDNVLFFAAGQIYEVGKLELKTGQTVYLEGGAVVKGAFHAAKADNIKILGRGILDGSYYTRYVDKEIHTLQLEHCEDCLIKDITILHPMVWVIVLGNCDHIHIDNVKELGYEMSTDGVDVCGSRNVLIENCCFKVNDDCVVMKAFDQNKCGTLPWNNDVYNVHVRNCVFGTYANGAIMEIGHEFTCQNVNNILFENIDVLGQHGFGSVFSVQNTDGAHIDGVVWENVRVEHCYAGLINIRIMDSMYSVTGRRGHISNIKIKNVQWHQYNYNKGYTISRIGGYNKDHMVKNVDLEEFYINGERIQQIEDLYVFTNYAEEINFC